MFQRHQLLHVPNLCNALSRHLQHNFFELQACEYNCHDLTAENHCIKHGVIIKIGFFLAFSSECAEIMAHFALIMTSNHFVCSKKILQTYTLVIHLNPAICKKLAGST